MRSVPDHWPAAVEVDDHTLPPRNLLLSWPELSRCSARQIESSPPMRNMTLRRGGRSLPSVREWFFRALGLLVALVYFATVALIPMPAGAAVTSTHSTAGHGVSLPFTELGLQSSYSFATSGTSTAIQLPVPQALTPSSVTGTLIIPSDFGTGTLVVLHQGNFVSSFPLPGNSAQQQTVP